MTLMSLIAADAAHAQASDMLYAQNNRAVPGGYQSGYGPRVAPQPNEVMTGRVVAARLRGESRPD